MVFTSSQFSGYCSVSTDMWSQSEHLVPCSWSWDSKPQLCDHDFQHSLLPSNKQSQLGSQQNIGSYGHVRWQPTKSAIGKQHSHRTLHFATTSCNDGNSSLNCCKPNYIFQVLYLIFLKIPIAKSTAKWILGVLNSGLVPCATTELNI